MREILDFCKRYEMLPADSLILAAVSGGRDSMCMLHMLHSLSGQLGFSLAAVHYNHKLRGPASDADAAFTQEACRQLGIPCCTGSGDVAAAAAASGRGIEETARSMRYAFFRAAAEKTGAARVATAHTADDNAETVLFNLTRGSGTRGLCGIPPVRDIFVRPLLCISRAQVDAYLQENGIPYREDATNQTDDYTRNRIRHHVIPVLKEINPAFCAAVSGMTALLQDDETCLDAQAAQFIAECCPSGRCPAKALAALPRAVSSRVVRRLFGMGLSRRHVDAVLALAAGSNPSASIDLDGVTVRREYDRLTDRPAGGTFDPVTISPGETKTLPGTGLRVRCALCPPGEKFYKSFTTFLLNSDIICGTIMIRPRQAGDSFCPTGRGCTKSLKKLLIEEKIPAAQRGLIPVAADSRGILAVYGLGTDARTMPDGVHSVLKITFEENI